MGIRTESGFSLLELILVAVVMALALTVLAPRLANLTEEAHRTGVSGVSSAYATAVMLVRSQWTAQGAPGAVENLRGFGAGNINVSSGGWPVSVRGGTDPKAMEPEDCLDLWRALLQSSAPRIAREAREDVVYVASLEDGRCYYRYLEAGSDHAFYYHPASGEVVTFLN